MDRILGVLAGEDLPLSQLAEWSRSATIIYAADGATDRLLEIGIRPDAIVGDLDSLQATPEVLAGIEIVGSTDQESSDADKLLRLIEERGHRSATLVGLEGDRLDHVLATLYSAALVPLDIALGFRTGWGALLRPGTMRFAFPEETVVSVLPLGVCTGVSLTGVEWPLQNVRLEVGGQISLSNRALAEPLYVQIETGTALLTAWTGSEPHWRTPLVP